MITKAINQELYKRNWFFLYVHLKLGDNTPVPLHTPLISIYFTPADYMYVCACFMYER